MKITIPPAALEAGARAAMKDNGCGYTANGQHVLCDDPALDGVIDAYGKPLRDLNCSCRSMARAAFTAIVEAWPNQHVIDDDVVYILHAVILPLTEKPDADSK